MSERHVDLSDEKFTSYRVCDACGRSEKSRITGRPGHESLDEKFETKLPWILVEVAAAPGLTRYLSACGQACATNIRENGIKEFWPKDAEGRS